MVFAGGDLGINPSLPHVFLLKYNSPSVNLTWTPYDRLLHPLQVSIDACAYTLSVKGKKNGYSLSMKMSASKVCCKIYSCHFDAWFKHLLVAHIFICPMPHNHRLPSVFHRILSVRTDHYYPSSRFTYWRVSCQFHAYREFTDGNDRYRIRGCPGIRWSMGLPSYHAQHRSHRTIIFDSKILNRLKGLSISWFLIGCTRRLVCHWPAGSDEVSKRPRCKLISRPKK